MVRKSRAYLHDIRAAADLVAQFTAGMSFDQFSADPLLRSAVERQLEIAGEALSQLAKADPATAARVSDFRRIIALRNVLIHGYADIDRRTIWSIVEDYVPTLRREVDALLDATDGSAP